MLKGSYRGVIGVLQRSYRGVGGVLQGCNRGFTGVLQGCGRDVTGVLLQDYRILLAFNYCLPCNQCKAIKDSWSLKNIQECVCLPKLLKVCTSHIHLR